MKRYLNLRAVRNRRALRESEEDYYPEIRRLISAVEDAFRKHGFTGVSSEISDYGQFEEDEIDAAVTVVSDARNAIEMDEQWQELKMIASDVINNTPISAPCDVDIDWFDSTPTEQQNGVHLVFYF